MLRKRILFILSILAFNFSLFAQQVFPTFSDGAKWNVYECFWFDCTTRTYYFEYDTTFCGQNYSKMNFYDSNKSGYFRSDSLKTYFRKTPNCFDKEYLIYDYSLAVGDTAFVGFNLDLFDEKDTSEFVLESIDTVNYFGVERQRFNMKYDPVNQGWFGRSMYWIKGIGSDIHPFYPFKCLMDGCEESNQLLCFDSLSVQLFQSPITTDCVTTILGISELENEISIAPNPFSDVLTFSIQNAAIYHITIYSSIGTKINEFLVDAQTELTIGTTELLAGSYFVEIKTKNGSFVNQILKLNNP
jgi:hypothetical protein